MNLEHVESRLRARLDALEPAPRAELLHILMLPDFERVGAIQSYWGNPATRTFGGLLIDCGEDRTLRAVLVRTLREMEQTLTGLRSTSFEGCPDSGQTNSVTESSPKRGVRTMRRVLLVAALAAALISASPALADPPLDHNPNAATYIFHCSRGAETQTFEGTSIVQNAAIAFQLVDGTGVIMYVHVEVNGQVVYDRPGLAGEPDLWTCTLEGFTFVAQMLVTPRG